MKHPYFISLSNVKEGLSEIIDLSVVLKRTKHKAVANNVTVYSDKYVVFAV